MDVARFEREMQLQHLDAIDSKAGSLLGFAGVIVTLVSLNDQLVLFLPAISTALWSVRHAIAVLRTRKYHRQSPELSYAWWANEAAGHALWQAYADEVRTLRANDSLVDEKIGRLKKAWRWIYIAVALTAAGIVASIVFRLIGVDIAW